MRKMHFDFKHSLCASLNTYWQAYMNIFKFIDHSWWGGYMMFNMDAHDQDLWCSYWLCFKNCWPGNTSVPHSVYTKVERVLYVHMNCNSQIIIAIIYYHEICIILYSYIFTSNFSLKNLICLKHINISQTFFF